MLFTLHIVFCPYFPQKDKVRILAYNEIIFVAHLRYSTIHAAHDGK